MYYQRLLATFAATLLVLIDSTTANAHGGGQDANGGHVDRSTGEYHCHKPDCVMPGEQRFGRKKLIPRCKPHLMKLPVF